VRTIPRAGEGADQLTTPYTPEQPPKVRFDFFLVLIAVSGDGLTF